MIAITQQFIEKGGWLPQDMGKLAMLKQHVAKLAPWLHVVLATHMRSLVLCCQLFLHACKPSEWFDRITPVECKPKTFADDKHAAAAAAWHVDRHFQLARVLSGHKSRLCDPAELPSEHQIGTAIPVPGKRGMH